MELEFRYLRDFLAVIESGSLGDAARRLRTSQPTLTRSIKFLEQSVGGAIFDRTSQGMRITDLGHALERRAKIILGELGSTQREIDDLVEGRRGQIAVGAGPVFGLVVLPRAAARFQAKHPNVGISIVQQRVRVTLPAVASGALDCAFHGAPDGLSGLDLAHRVVMRGHTIAVVAHRNHPLARKKRISLAEIARQPWLLPPPPDFLRTRFDAVFARAGLVPPTPLIEYVSVTGAPHFLFENKSLVTFIIDTMFENDSTSRHLARLEVPELARRTDTSVIFRRGMPMPPAAALFLDYVRTVCGELA